MKVIVNYAWSDEGELVLNYVKKWNGGKLMDVVEEELKKCGRGDLDWFRGGKDIEEEEDEYRYISECENWISVGGEDGNGKWGEVWELEEVK